MKRRHSLPLLQPLLDDVYNIDTSAWLDIDSLPDSEDAWQLVLALIQQGRIVACAQVLGELRDSPVYGRLKPYEKALQLGDYDSDDPGYLQRVGRITHDHPAMSRATGSRTPADPYVVALAQIENHVVVANESMKRPNRKIPGVCKTLGIRCITLAEFISAARSTMKVK